MADNEYPPTEFLIACDECDEDYDPQLGCPHDRWLCESCLINCADCRADMRDDMAVDAAEDREGR